MKILATKEKEARFFQHRVESTHYMHCPKSKSTSSLNANAHACICFLLSYCVNDKKNAKYKSELSFLSK